MKYKINGSINMNFQYGQTVKLTEVLYVPQAAENVLSASRLVSKDATMGATQEK